MKITYGPIVERTDERVVLQIQNTKIGQILESRYNVGRLNTVNFFVERKIVVLQVEFGQVDGRNECVPMNSVQTIVVQLQGDDAVQAFQKGSVDGKLC